MIISSNLSFQIVPNECKSYKWLKDGNRAAAHSSQPLLCDDKLVAAWYRFGGAAGNNMATSYVPKNRCGTHAPGWIEGGLPSGKYQLVDRKVCFHWGSNHCNWNKMIKVRNCGEFNVYYLSKPPACKLRYCGNAKSGKSTSLSYFFWYLFLSRSKKQFHKKESIPYSLIHVTICCRR